MFVVWRSRERELVYRVRHSARLVESVRIDGKPRQRFVAYLGSFESASDDAPNGALNPGYMVTQRLRFWRNARHALDGLGERITAEQRHAIEAALARRIEPPTPAQIKKQWEESGKALMMIMGFNPSHPALPELILSHTNSKPEEA